MMKMIMTLVMMMIIIILLAYTFLPIAMETLGSMNDSAYHFFEDFGRKISQISSDSREGSFIFQRLSVTIQRSNAALFQESFTLARRSGPLAIPHLLLIFFFVLTSGPILPV